MGYRSTVRVSTTEEGYGKLVSALWRKNGLEGIPYPLVGIGWDGCERVFDYISHEENGVIIGFDDIKWYDSYQEVAAFEAVLDELDDAGVPFCFVRLGEEDADIEERATGNAYDTDMPHVHSVAGWNWW